MITFLVSHFKFGVAGTTAAGQMDLFLYFYILQFGGSGCLSPSFLFLGSSTVGDRYKVHFAAIQSCADD
jgi:hypothetical protein